MLCDLCSDLAVEHMASGPERKDHAQMKVNIEASILSAFPRGGGGGGGGAPCMLCQQNRCSHSYLKFENCIACDVIRLPRVTQGRMAMKNFQTYTHA